jgi:transketolase
MQDRKLKSIRDGFGESLLKHCQENSKIIVISPDVCATTRADLVKKSLPNQYVSAGIAEQNTIGVASGLADTGLIPVAALFAQFASTKASDQILGSVAYPNANVKIIGAHGGINVGLDGASHQAIIDIAVMRAMPNMVILTPGDATEADSLLQLALEHQGPVYLRLEREPVEIINLGDYPHEIGKGLIIKDGQDVTLMAIGTMVTKALDIATAIEKGSNVSVRVVDMYSLKPIDQELILRCMRETNGIVTMEDHNRIGGLYSAVSEVVAPYGETKVRFVAVNDTFAESGSAKDLWEKYGLSESNVKKQVSEILKG